jgi:hypothetical protein
MLPDLQRADRIGEFWGNPESRTFGELLIDYEDDRTLRAVLIGVLRDDGREQTPGEPVASLVPSRQLTSTRGDPAAGPRRATVRMA